ncbi:MAG: signal recognition particle protein [Candidatus Tectomicrobia bacterium]|nr:signal recognition particle protein [Candidatus Tectomicrobia bacterium]
MFESLTQRLEGIFKKLRGRGTLNERDVGEALREIRVALLEADVNYTVVKSFVEKVRQRAVGAEVLASLTPAQQVIKIVNEELTRLMGAQGAELQWAPSAPTIVMMCGLQGSGKTTSTAKLAAKFRQEGKRPLMVAADIQRPAAIQQLQTLGKQIGVPVHVGGPGESPLRICQEAVRVAAAQHCDVLLLDTAGRLHVNTELMEELREIKARLQPHEVLLVVDAMTGQDAVNVAKAFHEAVQLDGVVLTKLDGDARGGAALSIREVTGAPIKFIGTGEKVEALEAFHPDRMASRILGMGDVLSLIDKVEAAYSQEQALELERKLQEDSFTLEDFSAQICQLKTMGPLEGLLDLIPGMKRLKDIQPDAKELVKVEAMISSMTMGERHNHALINGSRRKRIARGSGTTVQDVNRLLKQFAQMKKMMRSFGGVGKASKKLRRGHLPLPLG